MKFALAILTFLALANLALADFSPSAISKKCTAALINLLNDQELEKCLPIGPIVLQAVADGPNMSNHSLTYFEDFADMAEKVCPAPKCSDSLIKSKLNEAAGPCSADLQALGMTGDQVADLVVQGYGYTYEILCFKSSDGEYCIVETVDNLKQYPDKTPPPEVICTDCNKAMYGPLTKLVNLVADSPIGKKLSFDPEKILHEDDVKDLCGDDFSNGTVPTGVESNDGSGDESPDTKNGTSNGSSSKGDVGSEGAENSGSNSSSKSSDNKNNVAGSAPVLKAMRSEYFVFGAIAIFAALL